MPHTRCHAHSQAKEKDEGEGETHGPGSGSGSVSKMRKVEYGLQGRPVIRVNGDHVKTKRPIPIVCGPSPEEVRAVVCEAIPAAQRPLRCKRDQ